MSLALLPLDERPVNVQLPADVAAITGTSLSTPPLQALPRGRAPGDRDALSRWLDAEAAGGAQEVIVSVDMLMHGGLIASRLSGSELPDSIARLEQLRRLRHAHPGLGLHAMALVQRAPDSYVALEEPEYWADHGRQLHALGAQLHRRLEETGIPPLQDLTGVPAPVVSDFESRRLRNHMLNLYVLHLAEENVLASLALTADDTAGWSAGSAEQQWLRHWLRALPRARSTAMYPGADEVGAVLVARLLAQRYGRAPQIQLCCAEPAALARTPPYENQALQESLTQQLQMAGAEPAGADPDAVLVVHAPAADGHDMNDGPPSRPDPGAARATGRLIEEALRAKHAVSLADVRYPNGSDPLLTDWLAERNLLLHLDAYSGWNTAGNTVGSALALQVATVLGRTSGHLDSTAHRRALLRRILDDCLYQSMLRAHLRNRLGSSATSGERPEHLDQQAPEIAAEMRTALAAWHVDDIGVHQVRFPWNRSFEVEIDLH